MGEAIEYSEVRCGKMPFNNWMDEGLIMDEERDDPGLHIATLGHPFYCYSQLLSR